MEELKKIPIWVWGILVAVVGYFVYTYFANASANASSAYPSTPVSSGPTSAMGGGDTSTSNNLSSLQDAIATLSQNQKANASAISSLGTTVSGFQGNIANSFDTLSTQFSKSLSGIAGEQSQFERQVGVQFQNMQTNESNLGNQTTALSNQLQQQTSDFETLMGGMVASLTAQGNPAVLNPVTSIRSSSTPTVKQVTPESTVAKAVRPALNAPAPFVPFTPAQVTAARTNNGQQAPAPLAPWQEAFLLSGGRSTIPAIPGGH